MKNDVSFRSSLFSLFFQRNHRISQLPIAHLFFYSLSRLFRNWQIARADFPGQRNHKIRTSFRVRITNDRACRRSEISSSNFVWNVHFCADFIRKDPEIACGGDLGASLICIHGNKPVIYGISSFAKNCGDPSWPGTYAKVSSSRGSLTN